MQRRKLLLTALLAGSVAVVLLFSSQLPALVFRYLDGSAQQRTSFDEPERLSLTLEEESGLSVVEKLKICTEGGRQEVQVEERRMLHTKEQALELSGMYLSVLQNNLGMETWQLDYQSVSASGWVYGSQQGEQRFRVWQISWESGSGRTASVTMDDETGLLLTISCDNAAGEADSEGMEEDVFFPGDGENLRWIADLYVEQIDEYLGENELYMGSANGDPYEEGDKLCLPVLIYLGDAAESEQETAVSDAQTETAEASEEDSCTITFRIWNSGWSVN